MNLHLSLQDYQVQVIRRYTYPNEMGTCVIYIQEATMTYTGRAVYPKEHYCSADSFTNIKPSQATLKEMVCSSEEYRILERLIQEVVWKQRETGEKQKPLLIFWMDEDGIYFVEDTENVFRKRNVVSPVSPEMKAYYSALYQEYKELQKQEQVCNSES